MLIRTLVLMGRTGLLGLCLGAGLTHAQPAAEASRKPDVRRPATPSPAAEPVRLPVGAQARLSGVQLDGKPFDLASTRGKVTLVVFWHKDCAVCRARMPELRANYLGWRDKPFELVSVATDSDVQSVRDYEQILQVAVPQAQNFPRLWRAGASHADNFGSISTYPTSFLLDRQGRVLRVFVGRIEAALWDDIAEVVLQ
ncbi:MAG TPA: TlpA disulfide reductase family protein [Burkholderiaceae bacterium]|nr:TlpA disulfide reductase family protein [Burkholderiaceae bacterium]